MAIQGPLREMGIHDVFQLLDLGKRSGILTVVSTERDNEGVVYFVDGAVVYAEVRNNPFLLGEMLIADNHISPEDLERARAVQDSGDGRLLGEILVDLGAIIEADVAHHVRAQVEEVVFELLSWHEGSFSFEEQESLTLPWGMKVRLGIEELLLEGARRIDEWSQIRRKVPSTGVVPAFELVAEGEDSRLDLKPEEWEVLAAVDGVRDVSGMARVLGKTNFEVARSVFGLESVGLLTIGKDSPAAHMGDSADLDHWVDRIEDHLVSREIDAARESLAAARDGLQDEAVLSYLEARVERASGNLAKAELALKRALSLDSLLGPAHREMGDVLAMLGRLEEAIEWWERWLRVDDFTALEPEEVDRVRNAMRSAAQLSGLLGNDV